jgi:DivIVA domain-containing protein
MQDALTPEDVKSTTFITKLRGYDQEEVDVFLATVAESLAILHQASENAYLNLGEKIGNLLQDAKDAADEIVANAQNEASTLRAEAQTEAGGIKHEAESHASHVQSDAESRAVRTEQEAQQRASEIQASAEREALKREEHAELRVRELEESERQVRERVRTLYQELTDLSSALHQLEPGEREIPATDEPPAEAETEEIDVSAADTNVLGSDTKGSSAAGEPARRA